MWLIASSCINIAVEITSFSRKHGMNFSCKMTAFTVVVFHRFWKIRFKKRGYYDEGTCEPKLQFYFRWTQWIKRIFKWIRCSPDQIIIGINVFIKYASSDQKKLKTRVGSCNILKKAHFAKIYLCTASAGKSSCDDLSFVRVQIL